MKILKINTFCLEKLLPQYEVTKCNKLYVVEYININSKHSNLLNTNKKAIPAKIICKRREGNKDNEAENSGSDITEPLLTMEKAILSTLTQQ